jgi:hypothetical protein
VQTHIEISLPGSSVNRDAIGLRFGYPPSLVPFPSEYWKEQCMANIGVGERFPAFILPDEQGEPFDLRSELAEAPLMLVFYRGDW